MTGGGWGVLPFRQLTRAPKTGNEFYEACVDQLRSKRWWESCQELEKREEKKVKLFDFLMPTWFIQLKNSKPNFLNDWKKKVLSRKFDSSKKCKSSFRWWRLWFKLIHNFPLKSQPILNPNGFLVELDWVLAPVQSWTRKQITTGNPTPLEKAQDLIRWPNLARSIFAQNFVSRNVSACCEC